MDFIRALVIGAGHVGSTAGYALILRELVDQLELIDPDPVKLRAVIDDLNHAARYQDILVKEGSYERLGEYDYVIVTAGTSQSGTNRLSNLDRASEIISSIAAEFKDRDYDGKVIIASNPLDLMTHLFLRRSGLDKTQVVGTGTLLDTSRYETIISDELGYGIDDSVIGNVYGEHGDSSFIDLENTTINGEPLPVILKRREIDQESFRERIEQRVQKIGYEIVKGQGATFYGIGNAVAEIVYAFESDEGMCLPLSMLTEGEYGLDDICISLPVLIASDILKIATNYPFSELELSKLKSSAETIKRYQEMIKE